jgi:hypothetical protein
MEPRAALRLLMFAALLSSLSSCWLSHERDPCPRDAGTEATVPPVCTTPAEMLRWTVATSAGRDAHLFDVGGTALDDVWVVGARAGALPDESGIVLHRDASGWSTVDVPGPGGWSSLWRTTASELWIAGGQRLVHFDGRDWTRIELGRRGLGPMWEDCLSRMWVGSSVGPDAGLHRLTGVDSAERTDIDLGHGRSTNAIWGTGANDVWVASHAGDADALPRALLLRGDGSSWSEVSHRPAAAVPSEIADIWGTGADDVWVVGAEHADGIMSPTGTIDHWDGVRWSRAEHPVRASTSSFAAVWGTSRTDVWALDPAGPLVHFDGDRWTLITSAPTSSSIAPRGWSADPCHVLIVNGDSVLEGAP